MKVLDPFAGYRLASGHPIFHASLFGASWIAEMYSKIQPSNEIEMCFFILRWSHCLLFVLAMFSYWAKIDSVLEDIKKEDYADDASIELKK